MPYEHFKLPNPWVPDPQVQQNFEAVQLALDHPVPQFRVGLAASVAAHFATGAFTKAPWDTINFESAPGMVRLGADDMITPVAGLWVFSACVFMTLTATSNLQALALIDSGTGVEICRMAHDEFTAPVGGMLLIGSTPPVRLIAGQIVHVSGFQNSGAVAAATTGGTNAFGQPTNYWGGYRVAGYEGQQYTRG